MIPEKTQDYVKNCCNLWPRSPGAEDTITRVNNTSYWAAEKEIYFGYVSCQGV